ncbi:unnamed protein product [Dimorphilus gyrociliatus]|uniref:F-box domain-containing protein n=1 Tax=Dimorphilus gyrociliatus TaxID=2664684 RepID=A0A7I8V8F1_9ANNE|nr:unnamed protein product [Dimorphilus gyrociliatus]
MEQFRQLKRFSEEFENFMGELQVVPLVSNAKKRKIEEKPLEIKKPLYDQDNEYNYSFLPKEIVLKIFSHLNSKDLAIAGQTCSLWRSLSKDESLRRCVVIRDRIDCENEFRGSLFQKELLLWNGIISSSVLTSLDFQPFANNLTRVYIRERSMNVSELATWIRICSNIRILSLRDISILPSESYNLPENTHLTTLFLDRVLIDNNAKNFFKHLLKICKKLKSAFINNIKCKRFLNLIFPCSSTIEQLNLAGFRNEFDDDLAWEICKTNLESLRELDISEATDLTEEGFSLLCKRTKNLEVLNISRCCLITTKVLTANLDYLPNLKRLYAFQTYTERALKMLIYFLERRKIWFKPNGRLYRIADCPLPQCERVEMRV